MFSNEFFKLTEYSIEVKMCFFCNKTESGFKVNASKLLRLSLTQVMWKSCLYFFATTDCHDIAVGRLKIAFRLCR